MKTIMRVYFLTIYLLFVGWLIMPVSAQAYVLTTTEIYRQARYKNYQFLDWVAQYRNAIDVQNQSGDTAYCMALKYNDNQTQNLLASYGANVSHSCVQRFYIEAKSGQNYTSTAKTTGRYPVRKANSTYVTSPTGNSNYLWWGLGALAVGGGVAAIASSGGGSSHHSSSSGVGDSNGSGEQDTGNNQQNDSNVGNGDARDSETGDNSGVIDDGDQEDNDDDNDNNNGDDNNGGIGEDNGGDEEGNGGGEELTNVSAAAFKTAEYNKGNFLDAIHAAEAYSVIYKKDKNGNLVSHQAASDEPLKKVKVGVVDTGVYNHSDFGDKIFGNYDANAYNSKGNIWGYARGNLHYYVFFENGKYHFFSVNTHNNPVSVSPYRGLDLNGLNTILANYSLTFDDFMMVNGANGGTPGVSDSGFQETNVSTWWNIASDLNHGTHIAGIIAANKNGSGMHGVAFENAEIYAGSWDYSQSIYPMVKTMVDDGVSVLNNSWGYTDSTAANANWLFTHDGRKVLPAYVYAANHGVVWVQATGNEGMNEAGVQAGIGKLNLSSYGYEGAGEYEVPFIAVTALDTSRTTDIAPVGQIADYANWCGAARGYCLAAPGTDLNSTASVENGYLDMDGTSMATPVVSGSIALLMGYYPYLSGQNIAWLLLETANNEGAYADSAIYGRGVLDLERALQPVGTLSTASNTSFTSLSPVSSNRLALSGAMQTKMLKAMPKSMTAFDALKRPFDYNVSNLVSKTHGSNANLRNEVSHAAMPNSQKTIRDEKTGFSFTSENASNKKGEEKLSFAEVTRETDDGASTRLYYAENSKYATSENVLKPTSNPYLAMNEAYGAENTLKLNDVSKLKLSLQTGENGLYERDYEQDRHSFDERSYAINAEYSFNMTDYLELATVGGMLYEENAMLGMNGKGGFAIKDGSTYYMGLKAVLNLTDNISLMAAYYRGYTQGQEASLLALSNMVTESYMIAGEYQFNQQNKVGLSLSSPISVVKGKATFNYATGRDNYSDTVYMKKLTSSLKPVAKEYDLGLYYKGIPQEDLSLLGKVEARFNADGEKGVTDYIGIIGISAAF